MFNLIVVVCALSGPSVGECATQVKEVRSEAACITLSAIAHAALTAKSTDATVTITCEPKVD